MPIFLEFKASKKIQKFFFLKTGKLRDVCNTCTHRERITKLSKNRTINPSGVDQLNSEKEEKWQILSHIIIYGHDSEPTPLPARSDEDETVEVLGVEM